MTDPTGYWALGSKMRKFGLTHYNFKEAIKKYPVVRIEQNNTQEQYKWLQDELGNNWIWSAPTQTNYADIYFLNEDDAIIFKLKFGSIDKVIAY